LENPSTRQVTATGILSAARSATSGNIILGGSRGQVGGRSAQDLMLLLQLLGALWQLPVLDLQPAVVGGIGGVGEGVFAVSDPKPAGQAGRGDPETPSDLLLGLLALTGDRNHVTAELRWIWGRHPADPSSKDLVLAGKESTQPWADQVLAGPLPATTSGNASNSLFGTRFGGRLPKDIS